LKAGNSKKPASTKPVMRMLIFPACVLAVYGILFAIAPEKAFLALKGSGDLFLNLVGILVLVFIVMLAFNLFLKPGQVGKFLGTGAGFRGIILSAGAGIISMGPVYAWYPLLKELKEKGAGTSVIAAFLYNRAIKVPLLPLIIAYFGWLYVVILTLLTFLGSIAIGYSVGALTNGKDGPQA
jgi:uncharacterized membrane protein YraQ (UPF0718 family)